jgi:hypothetical protein
MKILDRPELKYLMSIAVLIAINFCLLWKDKPRLIGWCLALALFSVFTVAWKGSNNAK